MQLEYLEDARSSKPRVLLLYGRDAHDVVQLREAIASLIAESASEPVDLGSLPGINGIDGCTLIAEAGSSNLGVSPIEGTQRAFRCVQTAVGWSEIFGLLEPFVADEQLEHEVHQYLSSDGPIEWIISTTRQW